MGAGVGVKTWWGIGILLIMRTLRDPGDLTHIPETTTPIRSHCLPLQGDWTLWNGPEKGEANSPRPVNPVQSMAPVDPSRALQEME